MTVDTQPMTWKEALTHAAGLLVALGVGEIEVLSVLLSLPGDEVELAAKFFLADPKSSGLDDDPSVDSGTQNPNV
jgi:hypothetical protein